MSVCITYSGGARNVPHVLRNAKQMCVFVFRGVSGGIVVLLSSSAGIVCRPTRLIRPGIGAIDSPDQSRQVFEEYNISEVLKKFLGRLLDGLSTENAHVWDFQGLYKQICLL